jgi:hypothetical protein
MLSWALLTVVAVALLRWLTTSQTPFLNHALLRTAFLQWLQSLRLDVLVLEEHEQHIRLAVGGRPCLVHLEQFYRQCAEAPGKAPVLARAAAGAVLQALDETDALPADWEARVVALWLPSGTPQEPALVRRPALPGLDLGYALEAGDTFRWLTEDELARWALDRDRLHDLALRNIERSCNRLVIDAREGMHDEQEVMLRFATGDGLDAARLSMASFFRRFSPRFQDTELLVAIPSRDSLYIIPADNQGAGGWLTWRSRQDHQQRPYPLLPAPLRVTEHGIEGMPSS